METLGEVLEFVHEAPHKIKVVPSVVHLVTGSLDAALVAVVGQISIAFDIQIFADRPVISDFRTLLPFASIGVRNLEIGEA